MTPNGLGRNCARGLGRAFAALCLLTAIFSVHELYANSSAFEVPLSELKKIEPQHVVQFRVVSVGPTTKMAGATEIAIDLATRGGFKIYSKGLSFKYNDDTLLAPLDLKFSADPVAQSYFDPFYKEPRDIHLEGTRFFVLVDAPLQAGGQIIVRFEACSVSSCLLPTHFAVSPATGAVSTVYKKADSLTSGSGFETQAQSSTVSKKDSISLETAKVTPPPPASSGPQISNEKQDYKSVSLNDKASLWVQEGLTSRSYWLFPALFFAGLLMNLTPCVYPMIPITLNVLSSFGAHHHLSDEELKRRRRHLPFFYVGGMVLAYSAMGVVAGMTGTIFGSLLQSTWVNVSLAILMFVLGLTMLGVFNMAAVQTFAARIPLAEKYPVAGVVTMGGISGLVSAPCTGPVLSTILLLIGQSKDALYGFVLMTFFALGFGAPYVALGLFSQKITRMPKVPALMLASKYVFSALMFGLALYYSKSFIANLSGFNRLFVRPDSAVVICVLLVALVFFLFGKAKTLPQKFASFGTVTSLSLLGLWMTLWLVNGFVSPLEPSTANAASDVAQPKKVESKVRWEFNWEMAKKRAAIEQKPVVVDAWAEWCAACLIMDEKLWNDDDVSKVINEKFIPVKLDFTKSTPFSEDIIQKWDLSGLPAVGFYKVGESLDKAPPLLFREALDQAKFAEALKQIVP